MYFEHIPYSLWPLPSPLLPLVYLFSWTAIFAFISRTRTVSLFKLTCWDLELIYMVPREKGNSMHEKEHSTLNKWLQTPQGNLSTNWMVTVLSLCVLVLLKTFSFPIGEGSQCLNSPSLNNWKLVVFLLHGGKRETSSWVRRVQAAARGSVSCQPRTGKVWEKPVCGILTCALLLTNPWLPTSSKQLTNQVRPHWRRVTHGWVQPPCGQTPRGSAL